MPWKLGEANRGSRQGSRAIGGQKTRAHDVVINNHSFSGESEEAEDMNKKLG